MNIEKYKNKACRNSTGFVFGGRRWIRTTEVVDNRFTVCPLWPLGNSPIFNFILKAYCLNSKLLWSWWTDSNPRPADYKSAALPTELHQRISPCLLSSFLFVTRLLIYNTTDNSICQHKNNSFLKKKKKEDF